MKGWRAADSLFSQDLYGVAEPVSPSENLDVTSPQHPKGTSAVDIARPNEEKGKTQTSPSTSSAQGLSVSQKLFFVGVIVALCALFLRSKGGASTATMVGFKEKSMA